MHNLEPPFGFNDFLGLGMKFCSCVTEPPEKMESMDSFTQAVCIREHIFNVDFVSPIPPNTEILDAKAEDYNPKYILIWTGNSLCK